MLFRTDNHGCVFPMGRDLGPGMAQRPLDRRVTRWIGLRNKSRLAHKRPGFDHGCFRPDLGLDREREAASLVRHTGQNQLPTHQGNES